MRAGTTEITPINLALQPEALEERRVLERDFPKAGFYIDQFLSYTGGSPDNFQPKEFRPYTFAVAKVSGSIVNNPDILKGFAADAASLRRVGLPLNILHGAGDQIDRKLEAAGQQSLKTNGIRFTPPEHMWAVDESVAEVNAIICEAIIEEGGEVESVGGIFKAHIKDPEDRGSVVDVAEVDTDKIKAASLAGKIVVARCDGQAILPNGELEGGANINADIAGRALAVALGVRKYIGLTSKRGIFEEGIPHTNLTAKKARELIARGVIEGGAIVKTEQFIELVQQGVHDVVAVRFDKLRAELLGDGGGTMIHA